MADPLLDKPRLNGPGDPESAACDELGEEEPLVVKQYVPPSIVPRASDYKTLDVKPVRLAPDIDPRRQTTQRVAAPARWRKHSRWFFAAVGALVLLTAVGALFRSRFRDARPQPSAATALPSGPTLASSAVESPPAPAAPAAAPSAPPPARAPSAAAVAPRTRRPLPRVPAGAAPPRASGTARQVWLE